MKRTTHRLSPNRAQTRPERMVFFDTETVPRREGTKGTRQEFRLGVAHYWRARRDGDPDKHEWFQFQDVGAFWDWCLKKATTHSVLHLVAHNLAFDAQVCRTFTELPARGWMLLFLYENGNTRLVKWGYPTAELRGYLGEDQPICEYEGKRWSKTILMMDDCNLFPGSIEAWGANLGFPKLTRPPYKADDALWWPYCKRDVEIMVRLWSEWFPFLDEQKLGTFKSTIGSQAFAGFRHAYMHNRIEVHTNEDAIRLERAAYLGGRTEAFWVGRREGQDLYKVDVNSMYPTVMYSHLFPTQLVNVGKKLSLVQAEKEIAKLGFVATVRLDCDLPVFPVKVNGRNIYPIGQFATTLCTPELIYALRRGWVREIGEYSTYRMRRVFYWFVDHFYLLKQQYERDGDRLHRSMVKLLLNSLYGKFGQAGYEDRLIGVADPELLGVEYGMRFPSKQRFTRYTAGGSVIEQSRTGEGFNSFVAIAAHVTAYARLYLWSLIEKAGREHVLYVDTDSLIVDEMGFANLADLVDPDRLGYLKLEDGTDSLEIRAPKDYSFGDHDIRKGIPLSASLLDKDVFAMETWPSLRTHIADGLTDTFHNRDIVKHLDYAVDWGDLQPDGWVHPYHYGVSPLFI